MFCRKLQYITEYNNLLREDVQYPTVLSIHDSLSRNEYTFPLLCHEQKEGAQGGILWRYNSYSGSLHFHNSPEYREALRNVPGGQKNILMHLGAMRSRNERVKTLKTLLFSVALKDVHSIFILISK